MLAALGRKAGRYLLLQISSGKLFQREVEYENHLRGVIYTNLKFFRDTKANTSAGSLLPTSNLRNSLALVYEFTELIESQGSGPGVLVSHGIDPYISDFSVLLSFALNCIATPDYELTNRLISGLRGPSTPHPPNKLVKRVFDKEITCKQSDEEYLIEFANQIIGLERKTFLSVMRAIRTYVTGMHRVSDDLNLAYTLLVAAVESLAQDFDNHEATWGDLDVKRRTSIDRALSEATEETAESVRNAILEAEQTSLARRFREFTLNHLTPSFFREEAADAVGPVAKKDVESALKQSYRARSQYIHNLQELPTILTDGASFSETCRVDRKTWLTLQGLSRVARHAIMEFIYRQPTIEKEIYDYSLERVGVVQVPLAPQYWVGKTKGLNRKSGPRRFEGFLSQVGSHLLNEPNSKVTDLTPVLVESQKLIPSLKKAERRPFIALYVLFNGLLPEDKRMSGFDEFKDGYLAELSDPSPEALFVRLLYSSAPEWNLENHESIVIHYFESRENKSGFRAPRVLEAGICLDLAERYRKNRNVGKARDLVEMAIENYPEHKGLRDSEKVLLAGKEEIVWSDILLPDRDDSGQPESDA